MIEQQIRPWEVLDEAVLSLYGDIWRENFVASPSLRPLAYADVALPIGDGQTMLEPKLEARMLQELAPARGEKILHIGCGSGYFAALLGKLCGAAISVEIRPALAAAAAARLRAAVGDAAKVVVADAAQGLPQAAPYDAIVLTGAVPAPPPPLFAQLKEGGRLLAVVGAAPTMHLRLFRRRASGRATHRDILETVIPPLDNVEGGKSFAF